MLQENNNDLEGQLLKRMQQEASLEMRISMLQSLTEQQGKTHLELAQEVRLYFSYYRWGGLMQI